MKRNKYEKDEKEERNLKDLKHEKKMMNNVSNVKGKLKIFDEKVNMMKNDRREGEDLKYEKPTMKNVSNVGFKLPTKDELFEGTYWDWICSRAKSHSKNWYFAESFEKFLDDSVYIRDKAKSEKKQLQ